MIKILTDSTSDLTPELVARYQIERIPLYVYFGEECYRDGVDFTHEEFWEKLKTSDVFPRTAQPSPADFMEVYRRLLDEGHEILFIGIGSTISGTVSSALLAQQEFPGAPIEVVDSLSLCMGIGLLCVHAGEMIARGMGLKEVAAELRKMVPRIKVSFIVDSLDYLYKGGRLSKTQAILGNVLNIHPRIAMADGILYAADKIRGKRRAVKALLDWATGEKIDPLMLVAAHCDSPEEAEEIAETLRGMGLAKEVVLAKTGAVISSHCGPGTVGIVFIAQED
ncbi:MAG: DegV family protein [Clostridia bacterium]|nr:DegV family protein [Clostridia bacterium]